MFTGKRSVSVGLHRFGLFATAVAVLLAAPASAQLVVAGGGGGAGQAAGLEGAPGGGQTGKAGTAGVGGTSEGAGAGGTGGNGGSGGTFASGRNGGGGAGYLSNGTAGAVGTAGSGSAGSGGSSGPTYAGGAGATVVAGKVSPSGGYGGGGGGGVSGGGGGGGYSGGGGGYGVGSGGPSSTGGGGGGSFIAPSLTIVSTTASFNGVTDSGGVAGLNGSASFTVNGATTNFSFTGSLATFIAPTTGTYDIVAIGAQGGGSTIGANTSGGYGARIEASGTFDAGTVFKVLVGGAGTSGTNSAASPGYGGGGGGGTFISLAPEPSTWSLMILGFGIVGGALRRQKRRGCCQSNAVRRFVVELRPA